MQEHTRYPHGPNSELWLLGRERATLMGGTRALHMQLAHPLVAQAIADTNFLKRDPYTRLKGTLQAGIDIIFGDEETVNKTVGVINMFHENVRGTLKDSVGIYPAGTPYDAHNPAIQKWVAATLITSVVEAGRLYVRTTGKKSVEQLQDGYVTWATNLFSRLDLDPDDFPKSYSEVLAYQNNMIQSGQVAVGDLAKSLAPYTMLHDLPKTSQVNGLTRVALKILERPMQDVTTFLLPQEIRRQFGYSLPSWEKKILNDGAIVASFLLRGVPPNARYHKEYRDAMKSIYKQY